MEVKDMSGQPRSNQELEEALSQVESCLVRRFDKVPPELAVFLPTIREALIELIRERAVKAYGF